MCVLNEYEGINIVLKVNDWTIGEMYFCGGTDGIYESPIKRIWSIIWLFRFTAITQLNICLWESTM